MSHVLPSVIWRFFHCLWKISTFHISGKVEESMKFMEEVDDIRKKKVSAELEYRNSMPASSYQQQKLRVCEICSAYLGIHDNDRRLADHFGGKLHLGFIKIREKLDGLLVSLSKFYHLWAITDVGRTRIPKLYACLILLKLRVCEFVRPIWVWCDILIS